MAVRSFGTVAPQKDAGAGAGAGGPGRRPQRGDGFGSRPKWNIRCSVPAQPPSLLQVDGAAYIESWDCKLA